MKKALKKIDLVVLVLIALISIVISILDFFDLIEISPNYPLFILVLLSMISIHLIVSHFVQEVFQDDTTQILKLINSEEAKLDIKVYKNSKEIESILAMKILDAKDSVYDLTWKTVISSGFSAPSREVTHSYLDKCIKKASETIAYKEIFVFNDIRRFDKLMRRIKENQSGYSCRYYDDTSNIPRIQFVIVDDDEIFFFASSTDSILCSIKNPYIIRIFKSYYDYTWNHAIPIKEGPVIDKKQLEKIKMLFESKDD